MAFSIISRSLSIYRKYFAQFFIFRLFKTVGMSACRGAYFVLCQGVGHPKSGTYQFLPLSETDCKFYKKKTTVDEGDSIVINSPSFVGQSSKLAKNKNPPLNIKTPALEAFEFKKAMIVGGVDFIFVNNTAIHHDLFLPLQHRCPAENVGIVSINRHKGDLKLRLTQGGRKITAAVTMIGQCSGNYAHWLTETLAKLPILDSIPEYFDLPLLVDAGLHPNIYASLDLINNNRREIIKVNRWESVLLDRLVTISHPGYERYVPHDIYSREAPTYVNTFSGTALRMLRDTAYGALEGLSQPRANRIYLSRSEKSGNIRQIENTNSIEAAMREFEIELIRPESMDFMGQVAACVDAEIIVAPIGASLANMIFAPPGCKVIVLSPYYDEASYFYYSNLAGVLGHKLHYVLGHQINKNRHPIHRDYRIEVADLIATLQQVISCTATKEV